MELMLKLPTMLPTVVLLSLNWIVSFHRNPSLKDGGNNRAWSGVVVLHPSTRKDGFQVSRRSGYRAGPRWAQRRLESGLGSL
jgi:hypothetical protein